MLEPAIAAISTQRCDAPEHGTACPPCRMSVSSQGGLPIWLMGSWPGAKGRGRLKSISRSALGLHAHGGSCGGGIRRVIADLEERHHGSMMPRTDSWTFTQVNRRNRRDVGPEGFHETQRAIFFHALRRTRRKSGSDSNSCGAHDIDRGSNARSNAAAKFRP